MDPIWAHFVGILAQFRVKTAVFSKIFFCSKSFYFGLQMVWDPQKSKIGPLYPPMDAIWACSGTSGRHATRWVSHIRAQPYLTPGKGHFSKWAKNISEGYPWIQHHQKPILGARKSFCLAR